MKQYFKNIYEAIATILIGMGVTWRHLFTRAVTIQYPHVKRTLPERTRMQLFVEMDDCIGCMQCQRACPVDCIDITTIRAGKEEDLGETSNGQKKKLHVTQFKIDLAKCCYCSDCVFPCPTGAIHMTPDYEFITYDRSSLLVNFSSFTAEEKAELEERDRKAKEALAAAKAAKLKAAEEAKKAAEAKTETKAE